MERRKFTREEIIKVVGENIRIERLRRRLSQERLSEMAGITPQYLSHIENGKVNPSVIIIYKICKALDLKLEI